MRGPVTKWRRGVGSCDQFHKHFTVRTYSPRKISCAILCAQRFENALAYLATAISYSRSQISQRIFKMLRAKDGATYFVRTVSYSRQMLMKLAPGGGPKRGPAPMGGGMPDLKF